MDTHELAANAWAKLKGELIEYDLFLIDVRDIETVDQVFVAMIEEVILDGIKAKVEKDEDRLCLVDKTILTIPDKPVEGRITVYSSSFTKGDGKTVVQPTEELVVQHKFGQIFITKRQA